MKADNEKYNNIIETLTIKIEENVKQNQHLRNSLKTRTQDLVLLKNEFSSTYNETINDLTLIINHIESESTNKINSENKSEEPDEDNPAAQVPKIFKLVPNRLSQNLSEQDYFDDGVYKLERKGIYLIGDQPLLNINSWRVEFVTHVSFGCCGFGIMSLDDPKINEGFRGNGLHPLFCGCCNGSWGTGNMSNKNTYTNNSGSNCNTINLILNDDNNKTFRFELDHNTNKFNVYDPKGDLFSDYDMNGYSYKENLTFVVTSNGGPNFSFRLLPA